MNKTGQIKFGETIGVIIIIYFIVTFGLIWYNSINTDSIKELSDKDKQNRAFEKYYFIVNSNLVHISQRGYIDKEFDLYSLKTMQEYSKTKEGKLYLDNYLGNSKIQVLVFDKNFQNSNVDINSPTKHFDSNNIPIKNLLILYDNKPSNNINTIKQTHKTLIPIRDEVSKTTYLGILEVINYIS